MNGAASPQHQVCRPQGWISAVVLVDGCIRGVWEVEDRSAQTLLKVRMFSPPAAWVRRGLGSETERLSAFLSTRVELVVGEQ